MIKILEKDARLIVLCPLFKNINYQVKIYHNKIIKSQEPQGALIAHLSTMSTSVKS